MKLGELIQGVALSEINNYANVDIKDICTDSRDVKEGSMFVAMNGHENDGHKFADQAIKAGAGALLCCRKVDIHTNFPVLIARDVRHALAVISGNFFRNPARRMKTVAVVGTNGKSTTAYLIAGILNRVGIRCGLIGTMYCHDGENKYPATLTTPDPVELNRLLALMADKGCKAVVSEVSAHAIYWKKTDNIVFDIGVFTNISQDHLDFFKDMQTYAAVKTGFFTREHMRYAVINSDDDEGVRLAARIKLPHTTYGLKNPASVFAINISDEEKCRYIINADDNIAEVESNLHGEFNVSNTLAAVACVKRFGVGGEKLVEALNSLQPPEGRFNLYRRKGVTYIIDFAHTPDGLVNLLKSVRKMCAGRLIVVFGCGGDRDRSKRPLMGKAAAEYADIVVVTSDNPRSEKRADIISDIIAGIDGEACVTISDRREATEYARNIARPGDAVVLAGKGSEEYTEENNVKTPYSDTQQLLRIIGAQ